MKKSPKRSQFFALIGSLFLLAGMIGLGFAADKTPRPDVPKIAGPSKEAQLAISGFQLPKGMDAKLFAAEPLLANPVAFTIDARGRIFICETFRQSRGVTDNRNHMNWLHADLAAQTVEDRVKFFHKFLGDKKVASFAKDDDRIRLIWDSNGDGKADSSVIFADGFNSTAEGTGAGVISVNGDVYYTNIPNLWRLRDKNGDGKADERTALHSGYGVRVAFRGHDMHGLTVGPDGRLYFSIGDRGYNVITKEGKRLKRPDTGAVFRCELDGSNLEVFAYGLRNPQELAFDDYGNLFTGDNNSDSGDRARWVYVVEGGDTGWRMYYQYLKDRGPWNREMIWYPRDAPALKGKGPGDVPAGSLAAKLQPAYTIPPVTNLADGPSGLTYYPGVGLPERYKGHFFLADFRGNRGRSGIRSFAVKPKGAGFELTDSHQFLWKILATDVDFGYDGSLYVSDWVDGWNGLGKGRIYRFTNPEFAKTTDVEKIAGIMRAGFAKRSTKELGELLKHPDRRIRQEAQFALAKTKAGYSQLVELAYDGKHRLAQIHAVWGIGQYARKGNNVPASILMGLAKSRQTEVRATALRVMADIPAHNGNTAFGADVFLPALKDPSPRVRHFAAMGIAKRVSSADNLAKCTAAVIDFLNETKDSDPILRHAGVMALTGIGRVDDKALREATKHPVKDTRLAALLAWRRLARERFRHYEDNPSSSAFVRFGAAAGEIAAFLNDTESTIVLEAARAHDEIHHISFTHQLALLASRPGLSDALLRRVMYANLREHKPANAAAVAKIAADARIADSLRLEAIEELKMWNKPSPLDRVTGAWQPINNVKPIDVAAAIRPHLGGLFAGSNRIRQEASKLAAAYGIKEVGPVLAKLATDKQRPGTVRVEAMRALSALKDDRLKDISDNALKDSDPLVRAEGRVLLAKRDPKSAVPLLDAAIANGQTVEKQSAIAVLPTLKTKAADDVLAKWMETLVAGKAPAEIQLDLLEAAKARGRGRFYEYLESFEKTRSKTDHLAKFRESLAGGDAVRGRDIFFGRNEVSCRRCHKIGSDGGDVGPDLSGIGLEKKRDYLLEAIVLPNKQIAKGFDSVILAMDSGKVYTGIVKKEDAKTITLMQSTGQLITLNKDEIDDRAKGKSAMPEDVVKFLSKSDLRDLVEFLSGLRKPKPKPGG